MSTIAKIFTYGIIAAVVVALVTHPAGSSGLMVAGGNVLNTETNALTGSFSTGGQKGSVSGPNGTFFNFQ